MTGGLLDHRGRAIDPMIGAPAPQPAAIVNQRGERYDSLGNVLTGILTAQDWRTFTSIVARPRLQQTQLDELFRTDAVIQRVCREPATDATRRWFELQIEDPTLDAPEVAKAAMDLLEDFAAQEAFAKWLTRDAKDGGSLMVLQVDDGATDLARPLDRARIERVKGVQIVDRWGVQPGPLETDPRSRHFDRPRYYDLFGRTGAGTRIHADRAIALRGIEVNDRTILETGGWGETRIDVVYEPLRAFLSLWDSIETTTKHFSQTVMAIDGLSDMVLAGREDAVRSRLQLFQRFRSTLKAAPIDAKDRLEETTIQYAGVAQLLLAAGERLATSAEMPLSKLFGHSPQGFSTDDKPGEAQWQQQIGTLQQNKLKRPINYLLELIFLSRQGPTGGRLPKRWQQAWRPLHEPTDKEVSEERNRDAQTDAILVQSQVITPEEARSRLANDPACPYKLDEEEAIEPIDEPSAPAPGDVQPGGAEPTGEKVADRLPPGITIDKVIAIHDGIVDGRMTREFGIRLAAVSLGIDSGAAAQLFEGVGPSQAAIDARLAKEAPQQQPPGV